MASLGLDRHFGLGGSTGRNTLSSYQKLFLCLHRVGASSPAPPAGRCFNAVGSFQSPAASGSSVGSCPSPACSTQRVAYVTREVLSVLMCIPGPGPGRQPVAEWARQGSGHALTKPRGALELRRRAKKQRRGALAVPAPASARNRRSSEEFRGCSFQLWSLLGPAGLTEEPTSVAQHWPWK